MAKIIELLPCRATDNVHHIAAAMLAQDGIQGLVLSVADQRPSGSPEPPYAAVIEAWSPRVADYIEARAGAMAAMPGADSPIAYAVSERVQKDHHVTWPVGELSPGVKAIYLVRRLAKLSDHEASERWRTHAATAREQHVGMSRYVQNGVRQRLSPDAPVYHGIAMLHFPSMEDLEQRMYDSEEGQRKIQQDVERLVAESIPLYTSEFILRRPRD